MLNSDKLINYSAAISSLVSVFKSSEYDAYLKSASIVEQAVHKLPPNMKQSWSLFTVKKHWVKPSLLDFKDWLKENAEVHDLMKQSETKTWREHLFSNQDQNCLKNFCIKFTTKGNKEANAIFFHKYLLLLHFVQR